ncbi:MAG: hypothetical protein CXR30_12000 [Geobacter sp.]|nr:MAG: hypothetical protein CXR30_12000 [Geobacter sp.]
MKSIMTLIAILFLATSAFAAEISERQVNAFMGDWAEAQNTGSYFKYTSMYSKNFVGIRRSGSTSQEFDYDAWLKDRKRMFKKKMRVSSNGPFEIILSGATATVKFEQIWESGTYKDKGDKLISLALENGMLKITREEMLFSKTISTIDVEDSEFSTVTTGNTPDGAGKYTSLKYKDCWQLKGYFAKHFDFDENSKECRGLKGWRLFYAVDLESSWLEIGKGEMLWSTQNEVVGLDGEYSFGYMQDLGGLARVEWRLKSDGTPHALVFQVHALDPNRVEHLVHLYKYYVIDLTTGVPQFCGSYKTKAEARKIADNPPKCSELEERPVAR